MRAIATGTLGTSSRPLRWRLLGLGLVAAGLLFGVAPTVSAGPLDDAKAQGVLGERYDGYLGVVKPSDAATALAQDINAKRKAHYGVIASREGTGVEAVAAIAGAKLVANAPSGQFVMTSADSGWKQVP